MPEIAEVSRIVHFLRLHLVGKKITSVTAPEDTIVFGKVGTSGAEVEAALPGRKVVSAGSQGKYFWITLDKPPHMVMHFGMTGWIHIKGAQTAYTNYYKKMKDGDKDNWPPRFWKWKLVTDSKPIVEVAFTDPRRLGRVRLVDCPGAEIRKHPPLAANGPDPVVDVETFTEEYLRKKMTSRQVPIKALLLDQTVISGIGNWVADEVLYQSKSHPEQYCNDFPDDQIKSLYGAIRHVCQTACDKLGESDEFPEDWLFHHRWAKGKNGTTLPNGEKLAFLTVGGRTSCYAPALQKKTGRVVSNAKEVKAEDVEEETQKTKTKKRSRTTANAEEDASPAPKRKSAKQKNTSATDATVKQEDDLHKAKAPADSGRRRSGRLSGH